MTKIKRLSGTPSGRKPKITGQCDTPGCTHNAVEVFQGAKHCAECLNSSEVCVQIPTQKSALGFVMDY
jgi:hypothetical protein